MKIGVIKKKSIWEKQFIFIRQSIAARKIHAR